MGLETGDNLEERPGVFCSGCVRDEIGELAVGSVILKDGPLISEVLVTGLGSAGMSANTPTSWSTDLLRNDAFLMTSSSEPHVKNSIKFGLALSASGSNLHILKNCFISRRG